MGVATVHPTTGLTEILLHRSVLGLRPSLNTLISSDNEHPAESILLRLVHNKSPEVRGLTCQGHEPYRLDLINPLAPSMPTCATLPT